MIESGFFTLVLAVCVFLIIFEYDSFGIKGEWKWTIGLIKECRRDREKIPDKWEFFSTILNYVLFLIAYCCCAIIGTIAVLQWDIFSFLKISLIILGILYTYYNYMPITKQKWEKLCCYAVATIFEDGKKYIAVYFTLVTIGTICYMFK